MKNILCLALLLCASLTSAADHVDSIPGTTSNTIDTKILQNDPYPNYNFGGFDNLNSWADAGMNRRSLIAFLGMDNIAEDRIIDSVVLLIYASTVASSPGDTICAYEVLNYWVEGSRTSNGTENGAVCWNSRAYLDAENTWVAVGCSDSTATATQGSAHDIAYPPLDTVHVVSVGWYRFNLKATLPQAWYDATKQPYGVILKGFRATGRGVTVFASSENAVAAYRPTWMVYSHDAPAAGPGEEPCVRTGYQADDCYLAATRAGYVPNFENDPDTMRVIAVVQNGDDSWDTTGVRQSLDTLNRIFEDHVNIHIDYSISVLFDPFWDTATFTYASDIEKVYFALSSLEPDSQLHIFFYATPTTMATAGLEAPDIDEPVRIKNAGDITAPAHETGHMFWLQHTHVGVGDFRGSGSGIIDCDNPCREWPQTYTDSITYPAVSDSARYLSGDGCPDTPADPVFVDGSPVIATDSLCQDSAWGTLYNTNLESYGRAESGLLLTEDQATIIRCVLETYFSDWIVE